MVAPKAVELRENAEGLHRRFASFVEFDRTEDALRSNVQFNAGASASSQHPICGPKAPKSAHRRWMKSKSGSSSCAVTRQHASGQAAEPG
jgi:hypothetical protein